MQLALRTEHIPFSSLCAFFDAAEARQRAGQDIINMVMGRPDFLPAPHINEAVKKAVDDGQVHYTSNYGLLELRQEVARKLKGENGLDYAPETEIVITAGVSEALHLSMAALLNPGDEALIPAPAFLSYGSCVHMASGVPVFVPTEQAKGFQPEPDVLSVISPRRPSSSSSTHPKTPQERFIRAKRYKASRIWRSSMTSSSSATKSMRRSSLTARNTSASPLCPVCANVPSS